MSTRSAKKHPGGRPPKLTPETRTKVLTCLRDGTYLETAAAMAGIHRDTLRMWLIKGAERPNGPYGQFARDAEKAMAESEVRDLRIIRAAAKTQWQAAAWRLERRHPERYALRTKVDNTHASPDGGPVQVAVSDDTILGKLLPELAGRGPQDSAGAAVGGGAGTPAHAVEVLGTTGATDPAG